MRIDKLTEHMKLASYYLTEVACNRDDTPIGQRGAKMTLIRSWKGALRGEYYASTKTWDVFCPCWHTGQAVKALVMAADVLNDKTLLEEASYLAHFLTDNQVTSGEEAGMLPAYEDHPLKINTSAVLESLDGLLMLAEATGNDQWKQSALNALDWVIRKMWHPETGKFYDSYNPIEHAIDPGVTGGYSQRPLLDDALLVTAWKLTGNRQYLDIAVAVGETLLREENPAGNWVGILPCLTECELIHPRHAYWWGKPMMPLYQATGDKRFLELFKRSMNWYDKAIRIDGGMFRNTRTDFATDTFGQATSGSACAAICFMEMAQLENADYWRSRAELTLDFCCAVQFTHPTDSNLKGAILEKILPPDGSDASPYFIRDLGTIFFLQAAAMYLKRYSDL